MSTKKGTLVLIKVGTKLLIGQNSLSYQETVTMIEISSKTSGNYAEFVSGRISSTMSVSGIASTNKEATEAGYWELKAAVAAGVAVTVTFTEYTTEAGTTAVTAAEKISVSAFVSGLTWEAPDNAANTFSCDLQVTGAPTQTTN